MQSILNFLGYFFEPLPSGTFKYMNILIMIAVVTLVASFALRIYLKKQKEDKIFRKLFRNLPGKLLFFAIAEGIYVLIRFEHMPYLSMRILNYLLFAYIVYALLKAGKTYVKTYPAEKKHHEHQLKMNQYLPRKKHG